MNNEDKKDMLLLRHHYYAVAYDVLQETVIRAEGCKTIEALVKILNDQMKNYNEMAKKVEKQRKTLYGLA